MNRGISQTLEQILHDHLQILQTHSQNIDTKLLIMILQYFPVLKANYEHVKVQTKLPFIYQFFPKNSVLYHEGAPSNKIYLILKGKISIYMPKSYTELQNIDDKQQQQQQGNNQLKNNQGQKGSVDKKSGCKSTKNSNNGILKKKRNESLGSSLLDEKGENNKNNNNIGEDDTLTLESEAEDTVQIVRRTTTITPERLIPIHNLYYMKFLKSNNNDNIFNHIDKKKGQCFFTKITTQAERDYKLFSLIVDRKFKYIIKNGLLRVRYLRSLYPGECVGLITASLGVTRNHTAIAIDDSHVLSIDRDEFNTLFNMAVEKFREQFIFYSQQYQEASSFFEILKFFHGVTEKEYMHNEIIYEEGEKITGLFIIVKGEIQIEKKITSTNSYNSSNNNNYCSSPVEEKKLFGNNAIHVTSLTKNQMFGEEIVLGQKYRNFTAIVKSSVILLHYIEPTYLSRIRKLCPSLYKYFINQCNIAYKWRNERYIENLEMYASSPTEQLYSKSITGVPLSTLPNDNINSSNSNLLASKSPEIIEENEVKNRFYMKLQNYILPDKLITRVERKLSQGQEKTQENESYGLLVYDKLYNLAMDEAHGESNQNNQTPMVRNSQTPVNSKCSLYDSSAIKKNNNRSRIFNPHAKLRNSSENYSKTMSPILKKINKAVTKPKNASISTQINTNSGLIQNNRNLSLSITSNNNKCDNNKSPKKLIDEALNTSNIIHDDEINQTIRDNFKKVFVSPIQVTNNTTANTHNTTNTHNDITYNLPNELKALQEFYHVPKPNYKREIVRKILNKSMNEALNLSMFTSGNNNNISTKTEIYDTGNSYIGSSVSPKNMHLLYTGGSSLSPKNNSHASKVKYNEKINNIIQQQYQHTNIDNINENDMSQVQSNLNSSRILFNDIEKVIIKQEMFKRRTHIISSRHNQFRFKPRNAKLLERYNIIKGGGAISTMGNDGNNLEEDVAFMQSQNYFAF